MGNFSYASHNCSEYYIVLKRAPQPIFLPTKDKVIEMSGRHGTTRFTPDLGERHQPLECWLQADSFAQLKERLDLIKVWINPLLGEKPLILSSQPDRYYNAVWSGQGATDVDIMGSNGMFTLDMMCSDPLGYALTPQLLTLVASPYEHTQIGTADALPLLELKGLSTGDPQKISITIGTKTLTYLGPITVDDVIEIDCDVMTVYKVTGPTRSNTLYLLEIPSFTTLVPGANNISVAVEGGASWSELKIYCRNCYL